MIKAFIQPMLPELKFTSSHTDIDSSGIKQYHVLLIGEYRDSEKKFTFGWQVASKKRRNTMFQTFGRVTTIKL